MTGRAGGRARPGRTRALLLVPMLLALLTASPTMAAAQIPGIDAVTECGKDAPQPQVPGTGMVGTLDPAPEGQTTDGTLYDEVGYAGLVWHTYDLGCGPDGLRNPNAVIETTVANWIFNLAKLIVAATNGLHAMLATGGALDVFDDLVVDVSVVMYDGVFVPWFGLFGVLLAAVLLVQALAGNLAGAARRVLYAAGAMFLASATFLTPLAYTELFDSISITAVDELRSQVLSGVGADPDTAMPNTLHEQVVVRPWLEGEFGSADSPQAQELGRDLALAQAFTQDEVAAGDIGEEAVAAKQDQFAEVADRAGAAYPYLQGTGGNRAGAAGMALAKAIVLSLFQFLTDLGLLLCQMLLRLIVMAGPILGLLALLQGGVLMRVAGGIGAALVQSIILAAAGMVHHLAVQFITAPSRAFSPLLQLLAMAVITGLMWAIVRPKERFRSIFHAAGGVVGLQGLSRQERLLKKLAKGQRHKRNRDYAGAGAWWFRNQGSRDAQPDGQRSEVQDAPDDEPVAVRAWAYRPYEGRGPSTPLGRGRAGIGGSRATPGDAAAGLPGGPGRPEIGPGSGGGGIGLRHAAPARTEPAEPWDDPPETVRAVSWRTDRSDPFGGSPPPTLGPGAGAEPDRETPPGDPAARRGEGSAPVEGPRPGAGDVIDAELYIPDEGSRPTRRRASPPRGDDDEELYRPGAPGGTAQNRPTGRRPEVEGDD